MNQIEIDTPEQLHAWLKEHGYFVECYCLSARPHAEDYPPEHAEYLDKPETVTIELAYQTAGGWMAGEERVMRIFRCMGHGVREWKPGPLGATYMDGGIEVLDGGEGLGLDLVPCGRLVCGRLTVEPLPDRTLPVEATLDPAAFSARVAESTPPTPTQWLKWFAEAGEDVVWRVNGGEEWPVGQIATRAYGGFLQRRSDLAATTAGVFVEVRPVDGSGFVLLADSGERWASAGSDQGKLWRVVREAVLRFAGVRVKTGNCAFTREQWEQYVRDGVLPSGWTVAR